jgi:hypothetical protein
MVAVAPANSVVAGEEVEQVGALDLARGVWNSFEVARREEAHHSGGFMVAHVGWGGAPVR